MSTRFSDIKRGQKLATALTNYTNYLQNAATRPSNIGQQGPRDLSVEIYLKPFTQDVAADEVLLARCSAASQTAMLATMDTITGAMVDTTIGANSLVAIPGFSASRAIMFMNATRSVAVETSDVTGLKYLKYNGTRYSVPFGATADTDDEMDVFLEIKAALLAANSTAETLRVNLSREKIRL